MAKAEKVAPETQEIVDDAPQTEAGTEEAQVESISLVDLNSLAPVSYTHLTLPTTPYV